MTWIPSVEDLEKHGCDSMARVLLRKARDYDAGSEKVLGLFVVEADLPILDVVPDGVAVGKITRAEA